MYGALSPADLIASFFNWKMRKQKFSQLLVVNSIYYTLNILPLNSIQIFYHYIVYSMVGSVTFLSIHILIQLISYEMKRDIMKGLTEQYKMAFA